MNLEVHSCVRMWREKCSLLVSPFNPFFCAPCVAGVFNAPLQFKLPLGIAMLWPYFLLPFGQMGPVSFFMFRFNSFAQDECVLAITKAVSFSWELYYSEYMFLKRHNSFVSMFHCYCMLSSSVAYTLPRVVVCSPVSENNI